MNRYLIEPLSGDHNRSKFVSGSEVLDRYLREQASQDVKRRIATCFVAAPDDAQEIAGYYTLMATGIALSSLARAVAKKLPRYPVVPAALIGRLAVARRYQGQGLGGILLADALKRISRAELGVFAMVVDAKDDTAQRFYEDYGLQLLPGEGRRLCLPITAALQRLAGS